MVLKTKYSRTPKTLIWFHICRASFSTDIKATCYLHIYIDVPGDLVVVLGPFLQLWIVVGGSGGSKMVPEVFTIVLRVLYGVLGCSGGF